jgi:hypothetical protein
VGRRPPECGHASKAYAHAKLQAMTRKVSRSSGAPIIARHGPGERAGSKGVASEREVVADSSHIASLIAPSNPYGSTRAGPTPDEVAERMTAFVG